MRPYLRQADGSVIDVAMTPMFPSHPTNNSVTATRGDETLSFRTPNGSGSEIKQHDLKVNHRV
jgi:hypothetical protein